MVDNNFYKTIIENSPIGYFYSKIIYDDNDEPKDYEIIEVNEAYENMVGIEAKHLIGKNISQIYKDTNKEPTSWKEFHTAIATNYTKEDFEYYFDFLDKNYKVKIHKPEKDHMALYLTDISKEIVEKEKLDMLSNNIKIQLWYLKDPDTYVSANKAHADFIGMKKEELEFKKISDLFKEEESKICIQGNEKVFKEKRQITTESWLYNYKNEKRLLRVKKNPKFDSKGKIEFVICSAEDITYEYTCREQNEIKERILFSSMEFTQELLTNENPYDALTNGIEMLGNATQVDRVYYWENHYDEKSKKYLTSQRIEWCLGDIVQQIDNPELQNVTFEEAGDFLGILSQNKPFSTHVREMKGGPGSTKQSFESQGILSILVLPVFLKDEFRGFIGFDSCKEEKEWSHIEISLLNSFVLLYTKVLEKKLLEESLIQEKENFNNFFNMSEELLFVVDFKGNIIDANKNAFKKLEYSRQELIGQSVLIIHPKDSIKEVQHNINTLKTEKVEYNTIPAITKSGYIFPIESRTTEGIWNGKQVLFVVSKDVSKLSISEEKFSKAFNNSGVSMFISKFKNGELLEVNDTFLDFIGYTRDEVIGKTTLELKLMNDFENRENLKGEIEKYSKVCNREIEIIGKDKKIRTGLVNIVPLNINNEKYLISSIIDITDRVEYEEKILEISNRDSLTGIYNRRFVYERMEEIIEEYKRKDKLFSVSIIDIDNFKDINDKYGHQIGDYVLKEFTKIINENLRAYDILGRYGGEEFIVVLNHSNKKESNVILQRILNIIRNKTFIFGKNKIKVTFSGGIASSEEYRKEEITADKLVGLADKRMYAAKNNGRDEIVYTKKVL